MLDKGRESNYTKLLGGWLNIVLVWTKKSEISTDSTYYNSINVIIIINSKKKKKQYKHKINLSNNKWKGKEKIIIWQNVNNTNHNNRDSMVTIILGILIIKRTK